MTNGDYARTCWTNLVFLSPHYDRKTCQNKIGRIRDLSGNNVGRPLWKSHYEFFHFGAHPAHPNITIHINHISLGLSQDLAGPLTCAIFDEVGPSQRGIGFAVMGSICLPSNCYSTSQALRSRYLGDWMARSELMSSQVFLLAVQVVFYTSRAHAVTGSETK